VHDAKVIEVIDNHNILPFWEKPNLKLLVKTFDLIK
jgi:hypothetical protein